MFNDFIMFFSANSSILIGALIGVALGILPIVNDSVKNFWRNRFREQVKNGIINEKLKPEDMFHLYERWNQDRQSVLQSLRVMLSDAIAGDDEKLHEKVDGIRNLIVQHEEREPFSELPENISIQLNAIKSENLSAEKSVTQLASSLNELYSSNKFQLERQKKLSFWGFIIGILGVLIGVASLYVAIP